MSEAKITVSILSWLLEGRLIKTLIQIPRTTSMPLNLCLYVQGEEQISWDVKRQILDASSAFMGRDIFFTKGNKGVAKPRAELLKRSAKTPYVFMTDNDMVFQEGSIDALYKFLTNPTNKDYAMVDLVHNYLGSHRTINDTKVIHSPVNLETPNIVDVDLIGAASVLIRKEIATIPNIIDKQYHIGTWDIDFSMNVRNLGWKIATICDKKLIAINDKTYRTNEYNKTRVLGPVRMTGIKIFEKKWGFSSERYSGAKIENTVKETEPIKDETIIITRAIYTSIGSGKGIGVLTEDRLQLMQCYFINSLRNQTDKDFTLYIAVGAPDNETTNKIKSLNYGKLNVKFIYIKDDLTKWEKSAKESKNWGREIDEGCPEDLIKTKGHPMTTIMARLDIDDWVTPGWIAHMKHMAESKSESRFLINYQVIGQAIDGRLYDFFAPHNKGRTSPFIALVQKSHPLISPYEDLHLKMGAKFSAVYTIPPSYAFMVIHKENRSNRIYIGDKYIDGEEQLSITELKSIPKSINISKTARKDDWKSRMVSQTV